MQSKNKRPSSRRFSSNMICVNGWHCFCVYTMCGVWLYIVYRATLLVAGCCRCAAPHRASLSPRSSLLSSSPAHCWCGAPRGLAVSALRWLVTDWSVLTRNRSGASAAGWAECTPLSPPSPSTSNPLHRWPIQLIIANMISVCRREQWYEILIL